MSCQVSHHTKGKEVILVNLLKPEQAYECLLDYTSQTYPVFCEERQEYYEDGKWSHHVNCDEWQLEVPTEEEFLNILGRDGGYTLVITNEEFIKIGCF